ncbi:MAG: glycosyltransferase family 2 protein [Chromatiales bacterium]|nr:glycosyltransferase family 2 protein [Chromatiales bacterium]
MSASGSVCAVVVTYDYDYALLAEMIASIHDVLPQIIIVDNNARPDEQAIKGMGERFSRCIFIVNRHNAGLAIALNQGIERALNASHGWVLCFDQDSRPTPTMLNALLEARVVVAPETTAAIGPRIHDEPGHRDLPFVQFTWYGVRRNVVDSTDSRFFAADFLITSGCLISAHALRTVGLMEADLFVDNVDLEWCLRARAAGFRCLGLGAAVLNHQIGHGSRRLPGVARPILMHGPRRQYFMMRNRIALYGRAYVPWQWKTGDLPRLVFKLVYFPLFVTPRWQNLTSMLAGIRDGVRALRAAGRIPRSV